MPSSWIRRHEDTLSQEGPPFPTCITTLAQKAFFRIMCRVATRIGMLFPAWLMEIENPYALLSSMRTYLWAHWRDYVAHMWSPQGRFFRWKVDPLSAEYL